MRETEDDFQTWVIDLAKLCGWLVYHSRPAQNKKGRWTTPMTGDPGWPDLALLQPGRLIFAELKDDKWKPTPEQRLWLEGLQTVADVPGSPVEVYLWRPQDREEIMGVLGLRTT